MSIHGFSPSLVRVLKQFSRERKSVGEREHGAEDDLARECKSYLALPIFALIRLIYKATSIPVNDLEWVAAFIDTPLELTPWKNPGESLNPSLTDPELDGLPYDKVSGENLKYLRSIHEELHKCDDDGRTADIIRQLEAKHPGVLEAVRAEANGRRIEVSTPEVNGRKVEGNDRPRRGRKPKRRPENAGSKAASKKKAKRSTQKGEAEAKLIATLTQHHKYGGDGCLNLEPVGNNELARRADVDRGSASAFFKKHFKGHRKYKVACLDARALLNALKILNGEFSPHHLFGKAPASEAKHTE